MTLDEVERIALAANPEIEVAARRVSLAAAHLPSAGALDDPMAMYRGWGVPLQKPWDFNAAQNMFSLSQTLPGKGKRALRTSVAESDVDAAKANLDATKLQIQVSVRKAFDELLRTILLNLHFAICGGEPFMPKDALDVIPAVVDEPGWRYTSIITNGWFLSEDRAQKLIDTFRAVEREHRRFLERAGAAIEGFATDWDLIGRIGVKTSARNQLYGTVSHITRGSINDEVSLMLPGGHTIVAVLTHESTEALGLAVGTAAFALIKASWVVLFVEDTGGAPLKLSARNQLRGVVQNVKRGAVNAEVSLALDGGAVVTAVVTNQSADSLGLAEGASAVAAFKASSVILGVKD